MPLQLVQHDLSKPRISELTLSLYSYQNQKEVAAGIKRAYQDVPGLKREDLFIVGFSLAAHALQLSHNVLNLLAI